ncbi:hypothetical protein ACFQX6_01335 [Streptosporangium lutulentum]
MANTSAADGPVPTGGHGTAPITDLTAGPRPRGPRPVTGMWETVPRLLGDSRYLVLATADRQGRPWATPYSSPPATRTGSSGCRHRTAGIPATSPNARTWPSRSSTPTRPWAAPRRSTSRRPRPADDPVAALATLNARLPAGKELTGDDLAPSGPMLAYSADVLRHFVLIRGGDSRFDNVTDGRLRVTRPR